MHCMRFTTLIEAPNLYMLSVPRSGFGMDDMAKEWLKGMRDCSRVDRAGCRAALIVQGRVCVSQETIQPN